MDLDRAIEGRSVFVRQPLTVAVLEVAQAWAPLPSTVIVRVLKKRMVSHHEDVLREGMSERSTSSDYMRRVVNG